MPTKSKALDRRIRQGMIQPPKKKLIVQKEINDVQKEINDDLPQNGHLRTTRKDT